MRYVLIFLISLSVFSFENILQENCNKYKIDCAILFAIIKVESNFNPTASNYEKKRKDYSLGLMQVLPSTAKMMRFNSSKKFILKPENNIKIGSAYLRYQLDRYGTYKAAVGAYNAGSISKNFQNIKYIKRVEKACSCDLSKIPVEYPEK